ncbi:metallophosphoesterase [Neobacillus sp. SM06]|uniref:metallophosphoesterase n=1 Tax=Neobacillus sp. SM06 TaxID=3422492 RepID=UPI003D2A8FEA
MSKVLIVSDSHGLTHELGVIKERHRKETELMIHCGDSQLMADHHAMSEFVTVRGNCDFDTRFPLDTVEEVGGRKIFVTHGHNHSVKTSLMNLNYRAQELQADLVCFGHSHVLGAELMNGILFLNPGSIRLPRERFEKTYVIVELRKEVVKLTVYEVNGKKLDALSREFVLPQK